MPTEPLFVSLADRVDLVHDSKRQLVYVSTSTGNLWRYDLVARTFVDSLDLGDRLLGVDLSPDQDTLLVAEPGLEADGGVDRAFVHAVDLTAWTGRRISFSVQPGELGTFSVAFVDADRALVTSRASTAVDVPARVVRTSDDSAQEVAGRRLLPDTMLAASAGGQVVAFAEPGSALGSFGTYLVPSGPFSDGAAGRQLHEIGVSRTGTQLAVPTSLGLLVYDGTFGLTEAIGGDPVLGVVYHPTIDRLYVSWARATNGIETYSSETFQKLSTLDVSGNLAWDGSAYVRGRLRIARDGSFLLVTTNDGIGIYPLL